MLGLYEIRTIIEITVIKKTKNKSVKHYQTGQLPGKVADKFLEDRGNMAAWSSEFATGNVVTLDKNETQIYSRLKDTQKWKWGLGYDRNSASAWIPCRRGCQPFSGRGHQDTNLPDLPKNLMKLTTFLGVEGASRVASLDSPLSHRNKTVKLNPPQKK